MSGRTTRKKRQNLSNSCTALRRTLDQFWKRTNISGMCNARSSSSRFRTYFWMTIFAVFLGFTCNGIVDVFYDFYSYPVVTKVTVEHRNQVSHKLYLILFILYFKILVLVLRETWIDHYIFHELQISFPAVTVCNQNRVDCGKLEAVKKYCKEKNAMSFRERNNQTLQNASTVEQETLAKDTICDKWSVSENKSVIDYLFEHGKCGKICRTGKINFTYY